MKARTIIISIAVVLLIAGTTLCIIGLSMADFNIHKIGMYGDRIQDEYIIESEKIDKIVLYTNNEEIIVRNSTNDNINITYSKNDREYFVFDEEDGVLTATRKTNYEWYEQILRFNIKNDVMSLNIPVDFDGDISVHSSNGVITLKNITMTGDLTANTSNREIFIENISCKNLTVLTSNGDIKITNPKAERKMYLETSNGDIEGDIIGNKEDFTIKSRTSNGRNNLPKKQTSGDKMLEAITSNGSIDIKFGW